MFCSQKKYDKYQNLLHAVYGGIIKSLGSSQFKLTINVSCGIFTNYIMETWVWKDNAIRRLYGTKHTENRGIDRGEITSAKVQCGNRSPLRFSSSLCLLNVSLSSFSASFSVVLSLISFLSYSLSLPLYSTYCADLCLSLSICSRFLPRFVYFVFFFKIQPPILTLRITSLLWNPRNPSSCSYLMVRLS